MAGLDGRVTALSTSHGPPQFTQLYRSVSQNFHLCGFDSLVTESCNVLKFQFQWIKFRLFLPLLSAEPLFCVGYKNVKLLHRKLYFAFLFVCLCVCVCVVCVCGVCGVCVCVCVKCDLGVGLCYSRWKLH